MNKHLKKLIPKTFFRFIPSIQFYDRKSINIFKDEHTTIWEVHKFSFYGVHQRDLIIWIKEYHERIWGNEQIVFAEIIWSSNYIKRKIIGMLTILWNILNTPIPIDFVWDE